MQNRPVDVDIIQAIKDIYFLGNQYRLIDRFVLRDKKKHPFAVIVPGGGYEMVCSFIEGVPIAKHLNHMGYSAFIVYYRTKEKARFPAPQDDLARAVKTIFENAEKYRLDTGNYSVWGGSAGGHLAAGFGTKSIGYAKYGLPKPSTMVLMYPVISMRPEYTHAGSRDWLLGKGATKDMEKLTSIDEQVTSDYPPTFIWCGKDDAEVSPDNTRRMSKALGRAGVPFECEIIPGAKHGIGPGTKTPAEGWVNRAVAFWQKYGNRRAGN